MNGILLVWFNNYICLSILCVSNIVWNIFNICLLFKLSFLWCFFFIFVIFYNFLNLYFYVCNVFLFIVSVVLLIVLDNDGCG